MSNSNSKSQKWQNSGPANKWKNGESVGSLMLMQIDPVSIPNPTLLVKFSNLQEDCQTKTELFRLLKIRVAYWMALVYPRLMLIFQGPCHNGWWSRTSPITNTGLPQLIIKYESLGRSMVIPKFVKQRCCLLLIFIFAYSSGIVIIERLMPIFQGGTEMVGDPARFQDPKQMFPNSTPNLTLLLT